MNQNQNFNPAKEFENLVTEELKTLFLPEGTLAPKFSYWLKEAIQHDTMEGLKCGWEELEALHTKPVDEMNMFEISFAINCVLTKTPDQLKNCTEGYLHIVSKCSDASKIWNAIVKPIMDSVNKKLAFKRQMEAGQIVPESAKIKAALKPTPKLKVN